MTTFILNDTTYTTPTTTQEFGALIESLSRHHSRLREDVLLYSIHRESREGSSAVASMVGEGKFGTLHLLFEAAGRPPFSHGIVDVPLSAQVVANVCAAFTPFRAEASAHPNVAAFIDAAAQGESVRLQMLSKGSDELKCDKVYTKARTNVLFECFNDGVLRGSDGLARQALLDSFSYLPNSPLSAEGVMLHGAGARPEVIRSPLHTREVQASEVWNQAGAIDKFPSLLSTRGDRLLHDGNRIIPSAMIRDGVHIGKRNIFMFHAAVNIAAYIGDDNLIDSHASVASAAQIGNRNKIGSFVSLEGVLSPANAIPVFIGDENFLGTFVRVGTGIVVGNKNFIAAGVNLSKGTKVRDCRERSATRGEYLNVQELNGSFNDLVIAPNNAARDFNGVAIVPGEYILFENSEEFMKRFEGDDRIKGTRGATP